MIPVPTPQTRTVRHSHTYFGNLTAVIGDAVRASAGSPTGRQRLENRRQFQDGWPRWMGGFGNGGQRFG
jgi:hypothetical protein